MMLNGVKTIILTPKNEKWKRYSELIEEGEIYEVFKEHNSPNLFLNKKYQINRLLNLKALN